MSEGLSAPWGVLQGAADVLFLKVCARSPLPVRGREWDVDEAGDVFLGADALVWGDLRLRGVPVTRPFRVPCMNPPVYGSVLYRPYRVVRQCCWYHAVNWDEATGIAGDVLRNALGRIAVHAAPRPVLSAVVEDCLPPGCSGGLRQAVVSLAWRQPIMASAEEITNGVHRITAMRQQGVKSTPALLSARAGQWLSEIPGAYPHQQLD